MPTQVAKASDPWATAQGVPVRRDSFQPREGWCPWSPAARLVVEVNDFRRVELEHIQDGPGDACWQVRGASK